MTRNPNSDKNLKPFEKGDPRINRKGRPRSFDKLRKLAQDIACELALDSEGNPVLHEDGHAMTIAEAILRSMTTDRKQRRHFFELAFGKVPDELNVHEKSNDVIQVRLVDYRKGLVDDDREEPDAAPDGSG